jgi:hypothetical protein
MTSLTGLLPLLKYAVPETACNTGLLGILVAECKEALARFDSVSETSQDTEDDGDERGPNPDNLKEVTKDFATEVNILVDLETVLILLREDKSAADPTATAEMTPQNIFSNLIALRYPKSPQLLVERLGAVNWKRFLRGTQTRQRARSAEQSAQNQARIESSEEKSHTIRDSGYGTEERTVSYAETVMSYGRNEDYTIRIPRLPKETPFECVYCGQKLSIKDKKLWK